MMALIRKPNISFNNVFICFTILTTAALSKSSLCSHELKTKEAQGRLDALLQRWQGHDGVISALERLLARLRAGTKESR